MIPKILNVVAFAILAGLRIYGDKSQAFQAIAHIYDGGLIWDGYRNPDKVGPTLFGRRMSFYGYLGYALAIVELTCFLAGKFS